MQENIILQWCVFIPCTALGAGELGHPFTDEYDKIWDVLGLTDAIRMSESQYAYTLLDANTIQHNETCYILCNLINSRWNSYQEQSV